MPNQSDSFWEWLRTTYWPVLDKYRCGGVNWVSGVGQHQYVGTLDMTENAIEAALRGMGFRRNPVAFLKERKWSPFDSDGVSEGSWVWRPSLFASMQLHVTLFSNDDGSYDVAAHWEASWIRRPIDHIRSEDFHAAEGVRRMTEMLNEHKIRPYNKYD